MHSLLVTLDVRNVVYSDQQRMRILGVTPNRWPKNFFLREPYVSLSCAWCKRYFFTHFWIFFCVCWSKYTTKKSQAVWSTECYACYDYNCSCVLIYISKAFIDPVGLILIINSLILIRPNKRLNDKQPKRGPLVFQISYWSVMFPKLFWRMLKGPSLKSLGLYLGLPR